jgi:hypothetical protein
MKDFTREVSSERPREAVVAEALQTLTVPLARHGYQLEAQTEVGLTYVRDYRPWWVWFLAICLFPIGLLAMFFVERAYITATFEEKDATTTMRVSGEGTSKVRKAFEGLTI